MAAKGQLSLSRPKTPAVTVLVNNAFVQHLVDMDCLALNLGTYFALESEMVTHFC